MFNRIITASILFIGSVSIVFANGFCAFVYPRGTSFYIGPMLTYNGISTSGNVDYQGMSPKLALGYGGTWQDTPVYLALELNGSPHGVTLHNHRGGTPGLKTSYSLGASLIPGAYIDDMILLYMRLGVVSTRFQNLNVTRRGYQVGAGLQTNLWRAWDIRAEYIYTNYRSINVIGSPKADEFGLGVIYKFNFG